MALSRIQAAQAAGAHLAQPHKQVLRLSPSQHTHTHQRHQMQKLAALHLFPSLKTQRLELQPLALSDSAAAAGAVRALALRTMMQHPHQAPL
jgi:hypothetical protein